MSRMISDLLEYSRVQTRDKTLEPVSMRDVIDEALANLHTAIESVAAVVEVPDDPPTVIGDGTQLIRVVQNLLGNAVKYHDESRKPEVRLHFKPADDEWLFAVEDNGRGIEEKNHDLIFHVFQRLNHSEKNEGTGIGLAIVKRVIERHGGRIWLESEPGRGSTFFFTLPKG